ncbi:MAG: cytochrome-c peroxidase [Myxococcales bacterium]|nr:cytochrome-c peroxidase [Myxococcales bacterium]
MLDETPPVIAAVRPPPLSGGTLLVSKSGKVVVSDPDRDRIVIVTLPSGPARPIALSLGDHPGRLVEDARGLVHVVLRDGGDVVTIDPEAAAIVGRRSVCSAPRGIAYDEARDLVVVVCAGGELVRVGAADITSARSTTTLLEPDLRDVVVAGDQYLVSRFRGATVLVVDADGVVRARHRPAPVDASATTGTTVVHEPSTAWRMIPAGGNRALMVHNSSRVTPLDPGDESVPSRYYGEGCEQPVRTEISFISEEGVGAQYNPVQLSALGLPVDVAIQPLTGFFALVDATKSTVTLYDPDALATDSPCKRMDEPRYIPTPVPQPVAVGFTSNLDMVVQSREPARLSIVRAAAVIATVDLGGESRADTGYDLFHGQGSAAAGAGIACASCHPEGRDDGHVWSFTDLGPRRTQSVAGTLRGTAPFHWAGDLDTFDALVDEVMARRMGAFSQSHERIEALRTWIEEAAVPVRAAPELVGAGDPKRGRAIFESSETRCADCHAGLAFTDNRTVDVGTGGPLQVPSLIGLSGRAPYMHDGCAPTIEARFEETCGGGEQHGSTATLSPADLDDLVAYLATL